MDIFIAIGLAWVVFGALLAAFAWTAIKAAIVVGIVCIVIGVITNGIPKRS